jgi:hypothetical protein
MDPVPFVIWSASAMNDIVSSKPIIDALAARGVGKQPPNPQLAEFDAARQLSAISNCVYGPQIVALKRNTMLITDSNKIGLSIDTDAKKLVYMYGPPIEYKRTPEQIQEMMEQMTTQVLGRGWAVESGQKASASSVVESTNGSRNQTRKSRQTKKPRRKARRSNR